MSSKKEFVFNGDTISVVDKKDHWEIHFPGGRTEKLYHHVNAEQHAIWMWERGRIDESSQAIGSLLERWGL